MACSEIDAKAHLTYQTFFGDNEQNFGDLMAVDPKKLPDFDVLLAGFPCQSFSLIGQRKGTDDPRGQVIRGLAKIIKQKRIKYFLLENVKGLVNHNGGQTMQEILTLLDRTGYHVRRKVLNTSEFGLPQARERVYFVGVRKDLAPVEAFAGHDFFAQKPMKFDLKKHLIDDDPAHFLSPKKLETLGYYLNNKYNKCKMTVDDLIQIKNNIIDTRQSDLRLYDRLAPTLRTGRHGMLYVRNGKLRALSGYEALLLQGIPPAFAERARHLNNIDLLAQAGNAMSVPVIAAI